MENIDTLAHSEPMRPLYSSLEYKIKHLPLKRGFDIIFSLVCLVVGAPIYLLIALLIFLTSPGNVLYAHERIGRGGGTFRCYKFRSMYPHADRRLEELLENQPELREEWEKHHKLKKDPRITPVGHFLRKTSLDELPQFWNVLRGDLSVVGPRPVVREEVEKFLNVKAHKILSVRPGLTGLWQVSGRSNVACYQTRIRLDEHYVDNHSFLLDLKLIAKTIPAMISARGAY